MASTFILTSSSYGGRYLQLSCSQVRNIAANKSTISWTLSSVGGSVNYYSTGPTTVTINGTQVYYKERVSYSKEVFPAAKGSVSGTIEVGHETLGDKSIAVSLSTAIYGTTVKTASGTWQLDSIPRQATITVASNFTDVANPSITFSNPGGFPMDVWLEPDPVGTHLCARTGIPNTGSYTWTLSDAEREALRNACGARSSCPIRIGLYSYINGVQYASYVDKTYTLTGNSLTLPAVQMTLSPEGGIGGLYVQNKSKLKVEISATGKYGAGIVSYYATVAGAVYNGASFTTAKPLSDPGNISVVGYATDSRGFPGSVSKQITVVPYSAPQISSFTVERQADGSTVIAKVKGTASPVENKNTMAVSVTLNGVTKTISASNYVVDGSVTFTDMPTDSTLAAEAKITDAFSTVLKKATVPTVDVTMDFHASGKGVAFGKVAERENLLDVDWDTAIKGTLTANHIARIDDYGAKDFNDLVYNTGYYTSGATPSAAGCKNYPIDVTGVLEVISQIFTNSTTGAKWGFAYQTYRIYTGDIYTRSYYTDTGFTAWKKIQFA